MVLSVTPAWGPRQGGSLVRLQGSGFSTSFPSSLTTEIWCLFGGIEVPGSRVQQDDDEEEVVECRTPAHPPALVAVTIRSVNGSSITSR